MTGMQMIDQTHAIDLLSWVDSANTVQTDFPIQNLPYGRFRLMNEQHWRIGVAIGDQVLDLRATGLIDFDEINTLLAFDKATRVALRAAISAGLSQGSDKQALWSAHIYPQAELELGLPCDTRDYTDFYIGIHHARATGAMFRPENPLLPNYKFVPIGYHGRASTLVASNTVIRRPSGQTKAPNQDVPSLGPCKRLDFELEMGVIIGQSNPLGQPVSIEEAEDQIFGLTLFNDWSARDIQAWEYQPLGPFLGKSFASTVSPWMVTMEALAPFRQAYLRPEGDPQPLPYLDSDFNRNAGAVSVDLEVYIQTAKMREAGLEAECLSRSNFAQAAYWTIAQLVAHHTVNGCSLSTGDLFGTGTLSGPAPEQAGSLLELSKSGKQAIQLANGETRSFLEDGDRITFKGSSQRPGYRKIGFGQCTGQVIG